MKRRQLGCWRGGGRDIGVERGEVEESEACTGENELDLGTCYAYCTKIG